MHIPTARFATKYLDFRGESSVSIPASRLLAKASLIQFLPVSVRVVNCQFLASSDAFGYHNRALDAEPHERLELAIGKTAVVDESGEISLAALPDLVGYTWHTLTLHDVHILEAFRDHADELPYWYTPLERTARYQPIVAPIFGAVYLYGA